MTHSKRVSPSGRTTYDIPWDMYILRFSQNKNLTWELRIFDKMDPSCRLIDLPEDIEHITRALFAWVSNEIQIEPIDYLYKMFGDPNDTH